MTLNAGQGSLVQIEKWSILYVPFCDTGKYEGQVRHCPLGGIDGAIPIHGSLKEVVRNIFVSGVESGGKIGFDPEGQSGTSLITPETPDTPPSDRNWKKGCLVCLSSEYQHST